MSKITKITAALSSLLTLALIPLHAQAGEWPESIWASWLPRAATPVKARIHDFNNLLNIIIVAIVIVVTAILIYTLVRFRAKANPTPSRTTHHVKLEIIWTVIPILILLIIVVPSFKLMYYSDRTAKPDMTLKVTGYQWFWGYSYPEQEIDEFTVYLIPPEQDDPKKEFAALRESKTYQRLLSTYDLGSGKPAFIVLPVKKNIRILVTAGDVLHSWAMPAFGIKKDAVPGRLNETWARIERPGIYYGQCSEICGTKHGFMPIEVRAVPEEQFEEWSKLMKTDAPAAMQYIADNTAQMAHPQIKVGELSLARLWLDFKGWWQN